MIALQELRFVFLLTQLTKHMPKWLVCPAKFIHLAHYLLSDTHEQALFANQLTCIKPIFGELI